MCIRDREKLARDKKVKGARVIREGDGAEARLRVNFPNKSDSKKLDGNFEREFAKYLTRDTQNEQTGETVYKMDADYIDELRSYAVSQGVETIKNRVDKLGVSEPVVQRKQNDIIVELDVYKRQPVYGALICISSSSPADTSGFLSLS